MRRSRPPPIYDPRSFSLQRLGHQRCRDGAYSWGVFEDTAEQGRFLETFLVESWMEHLRQHHRVTHADRDLQEAVDRYRLDGAPEVSHLVAVAARQQRSQW
jgi:Transmembrane secretion effector